MSHPSILYGVQGTGNGHISRARLMASEFAKQDVSVQYVFSGRDQNHYFDMEPFGQASYFAGLSLACKNGRVNRCKTLLESAPLSFVRDIKNMRTDRHDLVLTDFEPVTAWSARLRGSRTLAIGHQYAMDDPAPKPEGDYLAKWLLKNMAPANTSIGFHWHPYQANVLPPMIDTNLQPIATSQSFTLVYLPFEDLGKTVALLQQIRNEHFVLYSSQVKLETQFSNVSVYPLSTTGFKHHLQRCSRVICNTGFELISEALYLGIPILTKPLEGQMEQIANGMALKQLKLATVTRNLNVLNLDCFVSSTSEQCRVMFPNVAEALAEHCIHGTPADIAEMSARLWHRVYSIPRDTTPVIDQQHLHHIAA